MMHMIFYKIDANIVYNWCSPYMFKNNSKSCYSQVWFLPISILLCWADVVSLLLSMRHWEPHKFFVKKENSSWSHIMFSSWVTHSTWRSYYVSRIDRHESRFILIYFEKEWFYSKLSMKLHNITQASTSDPFTKWGGVLVFFKSTWDIPCELLRQLDWRALATLVISVGILNIVHDTSINELIDLNILSPKLNSPGVSTPFL